MKQIVGTDVGSYTFNASAKTITLVGLSTVLQQQLLIITNTSHNVVMYQFNNALLGGTIAGNVITVICNTSSMSNTDSLQIIIDYQEQPIPAGSNAIGAVSVSNFPSTQAVSGTVAVSNFPATQPVSAASLPLPTGASTATLQSTGNTTLATIATNTTNAGTPSVTGTVTANAGTNLNTSALALEAGGHLASVDGKLTDDGSGNLKVNVAAGSLTVTEASVGVNGAAIPTSSNQAGAKDPSGNLQPLKVNVSGALLSDGSAVTQPISASTLPLPTGASTSALQTTANSSLATIATNTTNAGTPVVSGTVAVSNFPATQPVSGSVSVSNFPATQPVSGTITANAGTNLNTSTLALESGGHLASIDAKTATLGTAGAAAASPVVLANGTTVTSASYNSTTGLINTDLLTGNVNGWFDATAYSILMLDVYTGVGLTAGTLVFEQTNDITNDAAGSAASVQDSTSLGTANFTSLVLSATSTVKHYVAPLTGRYFRVRLSVALTGTGTAGATAVFKQTPYSTLYPGIAQPTSAPLNVSVVSGVVAAPVLFQDFTGTITTTTTTATIAASFSTSFQTTIDVTAASGTNPTMDVEVQESRDGGLTWVPIYDFPRITTTGSYASPFMLTTGNRIRYAQTLGGTTPSFTRTANRGQSNNPGVVIRQIIDRTINLNLLASATVSLNAEINTKNVQLSINIGAATGAPILQIQASDDIGASWYNIGTPLTAVASSTVSLTVTGVTAALYRAAVSTAGSGATTGYTLLRAF